MSTGYIYGLICPKTARVMYVGQSVDPKLRFSQHLHSDGNTDKDLWVQELKNEQLHPVFVIIEECAKENLGIRERFWIESMKNANPDLKNSTYAKDYQNKSDCVAPRLYIDLPRLLNRLRIEKGKSYTQAELAQRWNLSRQSVNKYLSYKAKGAELQTFGKLLDFFAAEGMPVTVADLFTVTVTPDA
jgi:hypothetical protein